jgi:hypothetical protein
MLPSKDALPKLLFSAYISCMSSGRVNSKGSLETAGRVLRSFGGSWEAVERAATRDENGVYLVRRSSTNGQFVPKSQRSPA